MDWNAAIQAQNKALPLRNRCTSYFHRQCVQFLLLNDWKVVKNLG